MRGGRAIAELVLGLIEPSRPAADLVRAARRPAAGLLQPDPRPARHAVRRPDPAPAVRVRRGPAATPRSSTPTCRWSRPVLGADDTVRGHVTLHQHRRPAGAGDRAGLRQRHRSPSVTWADKELKAYRQVDVAPGERGRRSTSSCRSRDCTLVDADAAAGSSSRASSSCWSARRRATRCCCGRASSSGTDPWASTPPGRRTTPSRRTTRASSPGSMPRVRSTARCSRTSPTGSTVRSRTSGAGRAG